MAFVLEPEDHEHQPPQILTMQIDAPEVLPHPCGFVRLRERHRVKAGSQRWELDKGRDGE